MNLFIPIILIIISIGTFFTFIDPNYRDIQKEQDKKESYDKTINNAAQIRKERNNLAEITSRIEKNGDAENSSA